MIKIQDIFDNLDEFSIQNWPTEDKGKQIKEYLNLEY